MRIALITLGCPKNLVDAEHMLGGLVDAGHALVADPSSADVVIVNTCAFLDSAVRESSDTVNEVLALRQKGWPGRVVVAGCLPERYGRRTFEMLPGVDAVVGCLSVERIVDVVESATSGERPLLVGPGRPSVDGLLPRVLGTPGHIAYLRISEGCDNRCAYCVIPSIRGGLVSRDPEDVLLEAEELTRSGVRELVPIAQDTTAYGMDIASSVTLAGLLERLDRVGAVWVRLLYAHPARVTDELLAAVADCDHVVRYMDVPIQHIADAVLGPMRRGTDGRFLRRRVERIRSRIPGVTLRTSVIVGFPGEDEAAFSELRDFLDEGWFEHIGVFEYSREEGSPAYAMGEGAPADVARERALVLLDAAARRAAARYGELVGSRVEVMVDEPGPHATGRLEGQAWELDGIVTIDDPAGSLEQGRLATVTVTGVDTFDLTAEAG
jgi:ribosomal protein S12 methylthiotransferase